MTDVTTMTAVDSTLPIDERIAFLRHCASKYEVGQPPISDAEYDREYYIVCENLEENDPENDFLNEVGGNHMYGDEIAHKVMMGSLSKCLDIDQFNTWLRKAYADTSAESYVLQHKIDGLSLGATYFNGKLVQVLTRGNGEKGFDVTQNAIHVAGIRTTIPYNNGVVEIRGEGYKDRKDFYLNWHESVLNGGYKNPRNFASGSMNQKDPLVTKTRGLTFVAYEVVQKDFDTEREKMEFLERNGFKTLRTTTKWTKTGVSRTSIVKAATIFMDRIDRTALPYDIDGVVVKLNDIKKAKGMGAVAGGRKPRANRAIKFPAEESSPTPILSIEECVGRTGRIVPKAHIKPVLLGGAMMTKATLHNYGNMLAKNITVGSEVIIAKKGDIIPQIIKVTKRADGNVEIPTHCPSCKEPVGWNTNKTDIVCDNYNCLAQLNAKIENWFKKIGVKGIGEGTISKLTDPDIISWEGEPIISSLPEMYYMLTNDRRSEHPFRKYASLKEFFGEQTYENIVKSIQSVNEVPLHTFVEALGISKIGSMAKQITDIAPSIEDIDKLTVAQVEALPGFGDVKAQSFIDGWKELRGEIKTINKYVKAVELKPDSDVLVGKKFCFTGSFSVKRTELEATVVANGGKKSGSVGKDTILVWDESISGGKYDKAINLKCRIINEEEFEKMLEV